MKNVLIIGSSIVWKLFSIGKETFAGLPFFLKIYFG